MQFTHLALALLTSGALIGASLGGCSDSDDDCSAGECAPDGGESGTPVGGSGGRSGGGSGGTTSGGTTGGGTGDVGGEGGDGAASSGGTSGGGGEDGNGTGGGPARCDRSGSPSADACLVDERFAVFVAPEGDDAADGTRAEPVATIGHAIELAQDQNKIVIACAGVFDERIALDDGLRIYGGFACPGDSGARRPWTYDEGTKTTVAPSARGAALEARDVTKAIVVEDFAFDVLDAVEPGESSIAAFVVRASDVTFRRVTILAGNGRRGADGTRAGFVYPTALDLKGKDGGASIGGASEFCTMCPGTFRSRPGSGGDPTNDNGGEGQPIYDDDEEEGPHEGGGGVAASACDAGGTGLRGAQGFFGSSAVGAVSLGTLTTARWFPAPGSDGFDGFPGQGGGGGAGKPGGGGGSGGCGGCAGRGGGGGQGGGASIGLVAIDSSIALEHSEIRAAQAGAAGAGAPGQTGQAPGGVGGIGFGSGSDRGCNGGFGGPGGDGGPGGGGAGGISVGILYSGEAPALGDLNTITPGLPGAKGVGGGSRGEAGIDGVARETLRIDAAS